MDLGFFSTILEVLSNGFPVRLKESPEGASRRTAKASWCHSPTSPGRWPRALGFLCVDCAKACSKIMLADCYGRVLIEPTTIAHDRISLDALVQSVRDSAARHVLKDLIVVIERTAQR